jgi:hypothetical protein
MTKTRQVQITIRTERLLVMSQGPSLYSLCPECGYEVRMITIDQAAKLARVSSREIYRQVERAMLHFLETTDGSILVCSNALIGLKANRSQSTKEKNNE